MHNPSMLEIRLILGRVLVMLLLVLPILAIGGAIVDSIGSQPYAPSFFDTLMTDLSLLFLFGFAPALITSMGHTELTRRRAVAHESNPRARSTYYGAVLGVASGLGLGLLICIVRASLVPSALLIPMMWGTLGGALYGLLVGPASPSGGRAA